MEFEQILALLSTPVLGFAVSQPLKTLGEFAADVISNHPLVQYEKCRKIINEANLYKLKQSFEKEISQIPEQKLLEPNIKTASAIYNAVPNLDNDDLRELFSKLIAATVNEEKEPFVHPAFSEILKNLTSCDAAIFKYMGNESLKNGGICVLNISLFKESETINSLGVVNHPKYSLSDIALSIDNLFRLNLIYNINSRISGFIFSAVKSDEYLNWDCIKKVISDGYTVSNVETYDVSVTELGKRLFTICC